MYARVQPGAPLQEVTMEQALKAAGDGLRQVAESSGSIAGILSPFLTVEEAFSAASYLKKLSPNCVLALGPVPTEGEDVTFTPDQTKGRGGDTSFVIPRPFTIHAEKCPNRKGVEAILQHFQGAVIDYHEVLRRAVASEFRGILAISDAIDPAFGDGDSQGLRKAGFLVVIDTHVTPLAQLADVVLAGATFAEKAGSYVNSQGLLQYSEAALPPRDGSLPDLDLLAILSSHGAGPVSSRTVLAEVAATVPAFAKFADGHVPEFGQAIGDDPGTEGRGLVPIHRSVACSSRPEG